MLVSLLFAIGLHVSGTPLLSSKHADTARSDDAALAFTFNVAGISGPGTVVLVSWPLIGVAILATIGAVTLAWPQPKPPRPQV